MGLLGLIPLSFSRQVLCSLSEQVFLVSQPQMDRCGISCNFITLHCLSQISLLNFGSCLRVILLIAQTLVPYTAMKASLLQTRKALLILPQELSWHLSSKGLWNMTTSYMKHTNLILLQKLLQLLLKLKMVEIPPGQPLH